MVFQFFAKLLSLLIGTAQACITEADCPFFASKSVPHDNACSATATEGTEMVVMPSMDKNASDGAAVQSHCISTSASDNDNDDGNQHKSHDSTVPAALVKPKQCMVIDLTSSDAPLPLISTTPIIGDEEERSEEEDEEHNVMRTKAGYSSDSECSVYASSTEDSDDDDDEGDEGVEVVSAAAGDDKGEASVLPPCPVQPAVAWDIPTLCKHQQHTLHFHPFKPRFIVRREGDSGACAHTAAGGAHAAEGDGEHSVAQQQVLPVRAKCRAAGAKRPVGACWFIPFKEGNCYTDAFTPSFILSRD